MRGHDRDRTALGRQDQPQSRHAVPGARPARAGRTIDVRGSIRGRGKPAGLFPLPARESCRGRRSGAAVGPGPGRPEPSAVQAKRRMSGPLNHDVIIGAAAKVFRVCVRLYPRRFRVEYGAEMEALFRRRMIRASNAGSAPLMGALPIAFQDALAGAVAERFPARSTSRGHAMFPVQGFRALDGLSLDFKLGGRMLVRYPGLTVIAGLAMAFAICVGTVIFQMMSIFLYPSVPLPQGDRLVQIRTWDV